MTRRVVEQKRHTVAGRCSEQSPPLHRLSLSFCSHMPGPHNAKKKRRGQKKKKNHASSRTHTTASSLATPTSHDTVPKDITYSPTLVTLLTPNTPGVHEAEGIYPDHCVGVPSKGNDAPCLPSSPYGPKDDPTLILLSNPIIHDPGNGPRVKDMRAFLNSSFSQPAWTDDPLCAEFSQREILQMLCTVLPEETALVRPSTSSPIWFCQLHDL